MRRHPRHVVYTLRVKEIHSNFDYKILEKLLTNIHYNERDCWVRGNDSMVYTRIRINGISHQAHRISYELFTGIKIPDHLLGLHECDVKACINPDHIFIGDHQLNMQDARIKGNGFNSKAIAQEEKSLTFFGPNPIRPDLR